jgi:PKD repeat protein
MSISKNLLRLSGIAGVAGLAVWGLATGREGSSFEVQPGSPSANAAVRFVDRTAGANAWRWDFGDGSGSGEQSPVHVYAQAGTYPVTLMVNGMTTSAREVQVVNSTTLRLMSNTGNPFDITLHAKDPDRSGNEGDGDAVPVNDVFGYFTIPSLVPVSPGAPFVPEVFVKMIDARGIGQDFWFFWGGLTDLVYKVTVRDVNRGTVKEYQNLLHKDGEPRNNDILFADTGGFAPTSATPTPTPTVEAPPPTATPTPHPAEDRTVAVRDDFFRDSVSNTSTTTISVGTRVEWQFQGGNQHTTTSGNCCTPSGMWGSPRMSSGSFSFTFNQAGNFPYFCQVHGSMMTGTVIVNP